MFGTKVHGVWAAMIRRCQNKNSDGYRYYGGRGITVCNEWKDASVFIKWALDNGYKDGLKIDRINNNGMYEPSNCRFITHKENCRNRRSSHLITINGVTKSLIEWVEFSGIGLSTIKHRIKRGISSERLLDPVGVQ